MAAKDTGAEQLIKDIAKRIFFAEGRLNATTQDIADAAGITRTLVNYYFRSKDELLQKVFYETMESMGCRLDEALASDLPFKKKVEHFIDIYTAEISECPYRESFMISEINTHGFELPQKKHSPAIKEFLKEVQVEIDNGNVRKMKPIHFLLNLFSLIAYPLLTRPLFSKILCINEAQYSKFITERKKVILDMLFV